MIGQVQKYSFINAKIKAMKSYLLDSNTYRQLLETTQLDAVYKLLLETPYEKTLSELGTKEPHIFEVSRLLEKDLYKTYQMIFRYFQVGNETEFINLMLSKIDVENIKIILRGKAKRKSSIEIRDMLFEKHGASSIDFDALAESKDIEQCISLLSETLYGKRLNAVFYLFEREKRVVILERALEWVYYQSLWKGFEKLSGEDSRIMRFYLGIYFDITNIMTILRHRIFYEMAPDDVWSLIFPRVYRLTNRQLRELTQVTADDYRDVLLTTSYGRSVGEFKDITDFEMKLFNVMKRAVHKMLSGSPFHIGTVVGFLLLKEMEVNNLKCIAEGKRHGLDESEIIDNLVM